MPIALGLDPEGRKRLLRSTYTSDRFPINGRWLGRIWPPAAFPSLPFEFDTALKAGLYQLRRGIPQGAPECPFLSRDAVKEPQ